MPAPSTAVPPAHDATSARRYRTEIDGLRALAVSLVVGYHVLSGRVSGGVDVFLALSGFFLVHGLTGRLARSGRVRPLRAISRTLGRLVPSAALVLAGTVAAAVLVLPSTRWREIAEHLLSAATFTENHRLVAESVDYAASNLLASPMQQFWSLSIQVQVLVAAPFLVAGAAVLLRRTPWWRHGRAVTIGATAAATAASFAWSVVATAEDQQRAYFSTVPRLWELGVGALAAVLLARLRPPRWLAAALGWTGVAMLVACGALLDGAHQFPGWQAAWPVLSAVAVIVAADHGGRAGVHRALSTPLARWLGSRSYALYLWHWPVLVLYLAHTGRDFPSVKGAVAIIVLSLLLAEATHRLVERPAGARIQTWRPAAALAVVAAMAAPPALAGAGVLSWMDREADRVAAVVDDPAYPGAAALGSPFWETGPAGDVEPMPPLSLIRDDWPWPPAGASCTQEVIEDAPVPTEIDMCVNGDDDRKRRVVAVGDSHVAHWLPPLNAIAEDRGWQVISVIRGGCNLSTESEFIQEGWPGYEECAVWRSRMTDRIVSLEPDVVIALGTRTAAGEEPEWLPPGFVAAWKPLTDAGIRIVGLRDSPRHTMDVPDCMAEWGDASPRCRSPRSSVYDDGLLDPPPSVLPDGVSLVDTSRYFCLEDVCPALIGNVRVYMDDGHVTGTYMRTVRPLFEEDLLGHLGW
ncbi:acyltransferase family protein [Blastococcus saxobsidens]|uniref:Peptidoglycan/LPS O-acetylase OafA/YrhL n=1 Tax=Blastococcus saxobsidens TaxID=138336 RepID=A0A4V2G2G9_9ACTN|nr:acyltransferase family protein [Blastococcus saxobsidens]RZU33086.1 peptidoglycan/LPS O-acetylase OafA/YrhL [Blastococcus saxobsidens]